MDGWRSRSRGRHRQQQGQKLQRTEAGDVDRDREWGVDRADATAETFAAPRGGIHGRSGGSWTSEPAGAGACAEILI